MPDAKQLIVDKGHCCVRIWHRLTSTLALIIPFQTFLHGGCRKDFPSATILRTNRQIS